MVGIVQCQKDIFVELHRIYEVKELLPAARGRYVSQSICSDSNEPSTAVLRTV